MANDRSVPEKYNGYNVWSYSKLNSYNNCAHGYRLNYIDEPKPKSIQNVYSFMGTICHDLVEDMQEGKIDIETALKMFKSRVNDMEMEGFYFTRQVEKDNYFYSVLDYIKNFKKEEGKFKVEQKEFLELDDKNVLMMFIDLVVQIDNETLGIYDYKTSSEFKKEDMQKHGRQLIIYAYTLAKRYKKYKKFKLAWFMLKYYNVTYNKRTKQVYRAKLVSTYQKQIIKELMRLGIDEIEANSIYCESLSNNKIPNQIQHLFEIKPCIIEYEYTQENINEMLDYLNKTINNALSDVEFKPCDIKDNEHFCKVLCGQRLNCNYLKKYNEEDKDHMNFDDEDLF